MCHPDAPAGRAPDVPRAEVAIPLPGGAAMPALCVGAAGAPPVLVVGDVFGASPFYEHLAARLAGAGFLALVPDFFFREGALPDGGGKEAAFARRARLDEARSLDDLRAAIAWLRERATGGAVGTIGFCMGGTFVLDLASTEADLVTVAYYGFPVPQASLAAPPPRPLDLVDGLRGPVLAFWGDQDAAVGIENVEAYVERATAVHSAFEGVLLAGLGHGFLGSADLDDPADPASATWARTLEHLRSHL